MTGKPTFFRDEFPRELNPELYKSQIDWEAEERLLDKEKKQDYQEKIRAFFKGEK